MAAISLTGLSKVFDIQPVLDAISLQIKQGKFVAVPGSSGCGRTTLLRLLAAQFSHQPDFRLIFSRHVSSGTHAFEMLQSGMACWLLWNVHPPLDDKLALIRQTAAQKVIPALIAPQQCQQLMRQCPAMLCWQHRYSLSSHWERVV